MCKCIPEMRTPFCGAPGCERPEQNMDIEHRIAELRAIAEPIGPLHSYWDEIFELEEKLRGRKNDAITGNA